MRFQGETMRVPQSVKALEDLGRVRLSKSFFMRDFLYSEIANYYGKPNIPENPDLAIEVGKHLCEDLLEPLNATFGRIAVRSAYRSKSVNKRGNKEHLNCGSNENNRAGHIWDYPEADGSKGATACVVVPWFIDHYKPADWRSLAYWIHDHLPYSDLEFFPALCAFNISWHEKPKKSIYSYIEPKGNLLKECHSPSGFPVLYANFPPLRRE
jgi:hypothetical protein